MRLKNSVLAVLAGLATTVMAPAQAQNTIDLDSAVSAAIDAIARKPYGPDATAVVVVGPTVPVLRALTISGRPATLMSREQAREEQRAGFVFLRSVEPTPNGLQVIYGAPAIGYSGSIVVDWDSGAWVVKSRDESHSSSGARYFYGELYEGVACRNGTEMARRWTATLDFMKLVQARQPIPKELPKTSGVCPGTEFPDVATYRDMKQLRR